MGCASVHSVHLMGRVWCWGMFKKFLWANDLRLFPILLLPMWQRVSRDAGGATVPMCVTAGGVMGAATLSQASATARRATQGRTVTRVSGAKTPVNNTCSDTLILAFLNTFPILFFSDVFALCHMFLRFAVDGERQRGTLILAL